MAEGLQFTYEVSVDNEAIAKYISEKILDDDRFIPQKVVVDSDHAEYIEFGSPPYDTQYKPCKNSRAEDTPLYKKLKEWYKARNGGVYTDTDVYLIFRKIMKEGTPPQPFIRPAVHTIEARLENGEYNNGKATFDDIALDLVREMERNLRENHTVYPGGEILDKIRIVKFTKHTEDAEDMRDNYLDSIWQSDYANYEGKEGPARERREHRDELRWK